MQSNESVNTHRVAACKQMFSYKTDEEMKTPRTSIVTKFFTTGRDTVKYIFCSDSDEFLSAA